jgi:Arc/MetJ-type ribon-helix-helix transcriptional regulator
MQTNLAPKRVIVVLPPKLALQLEHAVAEHETSISEFIRESVRQRLASERRPPVYDAPAPTRPLQTRGGA